MKRNWKAFVVSVSGCFSMVLGLGCLIGFAIYAMVNGVSTDVMLIGLLVVGFWLCQYADRDLRTARKLKEEEKKNGKISKPIQSR